jgi:hypothetical protein
MVKFFATFLFAAVLSWGAVACGEPIVNPDVTPLRVDDPCWNQTLFARHGAIATVALSDNIISKGQASDFDPDVLFLVDFNTVAEGIAGIWTQWIGEATAHQVFAEVAHVEVPKTAGWSFLATIPMGGEVPVWMRDDTDMDKFNRNEPYVVWVDQVGKATQVPEPSTWAFGALGVAWIAFARGVKRTG